MYKESGGRMAKDNECDDRCYAISVLRSESSALAQESKEPRPFLQRIHLRISDLSPPQALIDAVRIHQQASHILQPQPFRLRVNRPAARPPHDADQRVDCKSPRGREDLHHREEGDPDGEVAAPVGRRGDAGAQGADGQREELALLPGDVAEAGGVPADVDDHGDEDDDGPRTPRVDAGRGAGGLGTMGGSVVARGTDCEAQDHDGYRDQQQASTADVVDDHEGEESADEIGDGDGQCGHCWGIEVQEGEDRCGEVHERVL